MYFGDPSSSKIVVNADFRTYLIQRHVGYRTCAFRSHGKLLFIRQIKFSFVSVPPGSWCDDSTGVMCTGGSSCQQNSCVCPHGHLISAHECVPAPNGSHAN